MPISEKEGERPCYPYMILFVDGDIGVPLNFRFSNQWDYMGKFNDEH
jgi:hypothetical protein